MKEECSNFSGDWDAPCLHCGEPHRTHQYFLGVVDGVRLIHRMPCEKEKYAIRKKAVAKGIALRTILWFYSVGKYLWGLVPFKKEFKLLFDFLKNIYVTVRALIYLRRSKPK